jgi:adenylate cyclase
LSRARVHRATELAAEEAGKYISLVNRAIIAVYRCQQELVSVKHLVEHIESEREAEAPTVRRDPVPAMCFIDLMGFTRWTEEAGDQAATELAATLASLVDASGHEHRGSLVKWSDEGPMVYFREPRDAVTFALDVADRIPEEGLPPVRVGVAAGPLLVAYGRDNVGRTVNLAARIAAQARPGQVLVSEDVVIAIVPEPATFVAAWTAQLNGFTTPVELFEAVRMGRSDE